MLLLGVGVVDGYTLVGCCGIYCGACFAYRGEIPLKARELKELLNKERFHKIAVPFDWVGDYREFRRWLGFLARMKCDGCGAGGGNPFCQIRRCCRKRGYISCAECSEMPCKKLDWITKRYRKWNLKNLYEIRDLGYKSWMERAERDVKRGFTTGKVIIGIKRK